LCKGSGSMYSSGRLKYFAIGALIIRLFAPSCVGQLVGTFDYLNSLTLPVGPQNPSNPWTFHFGDETGILMPVLAATTTLSDNAYGYPPPVYARFGYASDFVNLGLSGTAGTNDPGTKGLFIHTATTELTTAAFNANAAFTIGSILVPYELVLNGDQGDGIGVTLKSIIGGISTNLGPRFLMTSGISTMQAYDFGAAGLHLNAGDKIVAIFDSNGTDFFDHGFFDVEFIELGSAQQIEAVPEPSTYGLLGAAMLGAVVIARRRDSHGVRP
jgi:PEP-CTERM motif